MSVPHTLEISFQELQAEIGFYLGYGRGAVYNEPAWDTNKTNAINRITKGGLNYFYKCGYEWSFLKPMAMLKLDNGKTTVDLPDDFSSITGPITLTSSNSGIVWEPLDLTGMGRVYHQTDLYPTTTGRPVMVCEEPIKDQNGLLGQMHRLKFWPVSDQQYTLRFQYNICPQALTGTAPYAYGGPQYAEVRLWASLAYAESYVDNIPFGQGPKSIQFKMLLDTAKELDAQNKPQSYGLNLDRSDWLAHLRHGPYQHGYQHGWSQIEVDGVVY